MGDGISLGERELDVMTVLWALGSGTVEEVREQLDVDLAYTTVLTILRNLEAKEYVRHATEGRVHRYIPRVRQGTAQKSAVARLLSSLFDGSPAALIARLVDDHGVSPAELQRIARDVGKRTPKRRSD
jgi:BlaI family transcriptional regulator, penicillinase repressor